MSVRTLLQSVIDEADLIFFDVETTGLEPATGDTICEIGAVKIRNRLELEEFHSLVNPKRSIPHSAQQIHGISDNDVAAAPFFEQVIDKFAYFVSGSVLCAYNISFDLDFINNELAKINYPFLELPSLDVLAMARSIFSPERFNLRTLVQYLNIPSGTFHRALDDARMTKEIFFKAHDVLKEKKITTVGEYLSLYGLDNAVFKKSQEQKRKCINECIEKKNRARIVYFSQNAKNPRTFTVHPREIREDPGRTLVNVFSAKTESMLTLSLHRILHIEVIPRAKNPPSH